MGSKWANKFELTPNKWVFVPEIEYRNSGKDIKSVLERTWKAPTYFWHLREKGHIGALKSHLGHDFFYKCDVHNFFNCINKSKITRSLKSLVGYRHAREIAIESTVINPNYKSGINNKYILPYGFIQSPIIASIVLNSSLLGKYLKHLNSLSNFQVSVYMDDIIISSDNIISHHIIYELNRVANLAKFPLNEFKAQGPLQSITAYNIILNKTMLHIQPDRLDQFKESFLNTESEYVRKGILGYLESVNESLYQYFPS